MALTSKQLSAFLLVVAMGALGPAAVGSIRSAHRQEDYAKEGRFRNKQKLRSEIAPSRSFISSSVHVSTCHVSSQGVYCSFKGLNEIQVPE